MTKNVDNAYNNIFNNWNELRRISPVNKCVVEFSKLLKPGAQVLDVGCGTGQPIAQFLSCSGFHVTGIDISEKMVEHARNLNLPNCKFMLCDVLNFCPKEKYDAVVAFDSLWHIEHGAQAKIYNKLATLLNAGGYLLFTHGKTDGEVVGEMFGEKFYYSALDLDHLKNLLNKSGFEIVQCLENYKEKTTGTRDLLIVAQKSR